MTVGPATGNEVPRIEIVARCTDPDVPKNMKKDVPCTFTIGPAPK